MLAYVAAKYNISGYAGRVWQEGASSTLPFWWCIGPLDKYVRIVQRLFFCSYDLCNSLLLHLPLFGKFLSYFAAWIVSVRIVGSRFCTIHAEDKTLFIYKVYQREKETNNNSTNFKTIKNYGNELCSSWTRSFGSYGRGWFCVQQRTISRWRTLNLGLFNNIYE